MFLFKGSIYILGLILITLTQFGNRVDAVRNLNFLFVGRDFPPMDSSGGDPDAYVTVYYSFGSTGTFEKIGSTLIIQDSSNPDWEDRWVWDFVPGAGQRLRFEIWDSDKDEVDSDADELIGTVSEIYFSELFNAEGGILEKELDEGTGRLIFNITATETSLEV